MNTVHAMGIGGELTMLGGATRYLFESISLVRGADLAAPTPCRGLPKLTRAAR